MVHNVYLDDIFYTFRSKKKNEKKKHFNTTTLDNILVYNKILYMSNKNYIGISHSPEQDNTELK